MTVQQDERASPHPGPGTAGTGDDAAVTARSRAEPEHFEVLFRRYAPQVQRYVRRRLGPDAADDVVAETFLVAFRQRDGYDLACANARPWLYGIATNLIHGHHRSEARQYRMLARTGHDPVTESFTDRVDAAVTAQGTRRQLAAALGVSTGTVRSRTNRARHKLRRSLGEPGPASGEPGTLATGHDGGQGELS